MMNTTTVRVTKGRRRFLRDSSLVGGAVLLSPGGLFGAKTAGAQEAEAPPSAPAVQTDRKTEGGRGSSMRVSDEIMEYRDEETGARVRRLTGDGSDNVHLYFTSESFLVGPANRLVFASNRSGRFQFHLLDIEAANLVQVTDGEDLSPVTACLDPAGRLVYFDGPALRSVALDTLEDRELYRVPEGVRPGLPSCTVDGRYIAFAYSEDRAISTETGRISSTMAERYYQHPSCVIMRIDTSSGQPIAAWGARAWISHVLIQPAQPEVILFCHEGGSHVSQRMWTVDVSAVRGREAKPLYPQRPNEFCVHEYFTRQGEVGFQYELDRDGQLEHYNCFIRPDGTWIRQFLLPGRRPGHIQSNPDKPLVVGDCGYLGPEDQDGGKFMSLMTHANGRAQVRRLCRRVPSSDQHSHGHPAFSLNDCWVLCNSMIGQTHNVYMADVHSLA